MADSASFSYSSFPSSPSSSSSSSSSHLSGYKTFRQAVRERLLHEMLRSTKGGGGTTNWKVLIMDEVTIRVMSYACKMADITEEGISLVEDLNKRRQPLPAFDAVYFIQPKHECVQRLKADMTGKPPLYKKAYVFFSSSIDRDVLQNIKNDTVLLSRLAALKEMNLEYLTIDSQAFSTNSERALELLFGEHSEGSRDYDICLQSIAIRLATVFASLKEFPVIRYRAARSALGISTTTTSSRDLVPTKLAAILWDYLMKYKKTLHDFPANETCELIIVDRTIDPVAPVIHEWTYDAICHDLLDMEGNKYIYEVQTNTGKMEKKEVLLEEHDPIWVELRDLHIAEVNIRLSNKMTEFGSRNKVAQLRLGSKGEQDLSTRDMQKMVQALPQYRDQLDKLSLHIDIATKLNEKIKEGSLTDIGSVEQDLVFGDASSKELIQLLTTKQDLSTENKIRLLMIFGATHPDKLEPAKRSQWMKLARLTDGDMRAATNLEFLGISVAKKQSGALSLNFGNRKNKRVVRKEKNQDDTAWNLSRFYPVIQEVVEALSKGELSKIEYPFVKEPASSTINSMSGDSPSARTTATNSRPALSMRTARPNSTWASRSRMSDDGYSSESSLRHVHSDPKITGKRIFVFIVGGATRSELKTVRKLTGQLKREVILGATSIDDPQDFVKKVKLLSVLDDISLDDLKI